jgi:hypothetical protein
MKRAWLVFVLTLIVGGIASAATPSDLVTPAEASDFRATPSYEETLEYVRRLSALSPSVKLDFYGESAQGRPLPLVIVSRDRAFTPAAAAATGKPILLIQNGIHAGEIDGKDACLMILRELALRNEPELLDRLILLVVPIYNVDGHERVSVYNRPNQNGPVEGMGFRTTTDGHDLNRDHVKLETPEARALIGLFNAWRPHLHVDNHVTDGCDHDWVLTYAWAKAPQAAPSIDAWLASHMPRVLASTEALGHRVGPYPSLVDRSDPAAGIDSVVGAPRLATGYYPLRNRPSILVENHSYKPYRDRVLANRDFLLSLFREIAREPRALVDAIREADERTVAMGRPDAEPSQIVLRYRRADPDTIRFPVYDWFSEPSVVSGNPLVRYRRGEVREIEVPWFHRVAPELTVARSRGYLVMPGWPAIERRLRDHGLDVRRLDEAKEIEVETMRIARSGDPARSSYQGLTRVEVTVERRLEVRRFPAGTLWIPADQADFELAAHLLEPDAPDSLVSWGLLSLVMERKEYISAGVLENLARDMLEDPEVAAEWEHALKDESFAGDRRARYIWWYSRTKHWDETFGLMPAMRLLSKPDFPTSAWPDQ